MEFEIKKWQDRQLDDTELFNQFITYWRTSQYTQTINLINNNSQLNSKSFVAGVLNILSNALEYLQNNYFINVEDKLAEDLDLLDMAINRFRNESTYIPSKQYYVNNFVIYNDLIYMCIEDTLGNLPIDVNYWVDIGLRGEQGAFGTGLNLRYSWNDATNYSKYDVIYLDAVLYVAKENNVNQIPPTSPVYWEKLMNVPRFAITLGMPLEPYEGQIWLEQI